MATWSGEYHLRVHLGSLEFGVLKFAVDGRHKKPPLDHSGGGWLKREFRVGLFAGNAIDGDFAVMVHLVGGVAIAGKTDVASLGVLAFHDAAVIGFDVGWVSAGAELEGIVMIGVEEGGDTGLEFFVIRHLDDHIDVGLSLLVVVPHGDFVDAGRSAEVDLHPLWTRGELDEAAVRTVGIAISHEGEITDDRGRVAGGDFLFLGEIHSAFRSHKGLHDLGWIRRLEVWQFGWHRGADEHRFWELDFDFFRLLSGCGRAESCDGSDGEGGMFHVGEGFLADQMDGIRP